MISYDFLCDFLNFILQKRKKQQQENKDRKSLVKREISKIDFFPKSSKKTIFPIYQGCPFFEFHIRKTPMKNTTLFRRPADDSVLPRRFLLGCFSPTIPVLPQRNFCRVFSPTIPVVPRRNKCRVFFAEDSRTATKNFF